MIPQKSGLGGRQARIRGEGWPRTARPPASERARTRGGAHTPQAETAVPATWLRRGRRAVTNSGSCSVRSWGCHWGSGGRRLRGPQAPTGRGGSAEGLQPGGPLRSSAACVSVVYKLQGHVVNLLPVGDRGLAEASSPPLFPAWMCVGRAFRGFLRKTVACERSQEDSVAMQRVLAE